MNRLRDICDLVSEQCDPARCSSSVYVGLEHITSGAFASSSFGRASDVVSSKNRFRKGDVLYGKLRPYLDKAVIAEGEGICSTDILVFRAKSGTNPYYLLSLLHSPEFTAHAVATTQGVNHPRTSWASLAEFECLVPLKAEQEKISALLWKLQCALKTEVEVIAAARALKQSAMRHLFARGLRGASQSETDYGPLPDSWKVSPLSECCVVQTGVTKGRQISPSEALEVPYLRVANVQDGHLDLSEMKTITIRRRELGGYLLQDGDVVLTEGGDFDKLGRGFIWRGEIKNCVHQNHVFAVRVDRERLIPEFFAYLAQSPYGKAYFLTVAHKTTNLACINATKLKALPVPIPDKGEQKEIADILGAIDRKIAAHERKRGALQELFKTLLHQLMTGQIRVADLDIDTKEVAA